MTVTLGAQTVTQTVSNFNADGSITIVVNQLPTIADQTFTVNENSTASPGTIVASDVDTGQTLTYSIVAGNTGNAFSLNASSGVLTIANPAAINYETQASYTLTIRVADNGVPSQSSQAQVTIQLIDLPESTGSVILGTVRLSIR